MQTPDKFPVRNINTQPAQTNVQAATNAIP
jgi:hypothetical protein